MDSNINIINKDENINEILFKSNTLIKGIINLTSNEYKIFNKILYKCQIIKDNEQQMMCKLTLEELKELVKNKTENKPKALLEQLERFMKIIIRFKKDKEFISTTLINTVKVDEETLDFDCYLNKEMFQVLMGYKEIGYSAINLKMIKQSNGYYTQRFYELFRQVNNAITILCDRNKVEKIKAPVKYLNGILENLKNKPDNSYHKESDNSKKLRFNNFEGREYDYEDLEKKLLGWK